MTGTTTTKNTDPARLSAMTRFVQALDALYEMTYRDDTDAKQMVLKAKSALLPIVIEAASPLGEHKPFFDIIADRVDRILRDAVEIGELAPGIPMDHLVVGAQISAARQTAEAYRDLVYFRITGTASNTSIANRLNSLERMKLAAETLIQQTSSELTFALRDRLAREVHRLLQDLRTQSDAVLERILLSPLLNQAMHQFIQNSEQSALMALQVLMNTIDGIIRHMQATELEIAA